MSWVGDGRVRLHVFGRGKRVSEEKKARMNHRSMVYVVNADTDKSEVVVVGGDNE